MHVQTCLQTQQHKKKLPLTSEKMAEEEENRHVTNETEQLIEKALTCQGTKMFSQFNKILMRVTTNSGESSMQPHSNKIIPFKVQMNMDIPNLDKKIDTESVDDWVQQLESYYSVNQLSEAENITIASLKMSTFVHSWWGNLSTNMEKEDDPINTWVKFVEYVQKDFYLPKYLEQYYKKW